MSLDLNSFVGLLDRLIPERGGGGGYTVFIKRSVTLFSFLPI